MRRLLRFARAEALPEAADVLRSRDLPDAADLAPRARRALGEALALLAELAEPRALFEEVSRDEFTRLYLASRPDPQDTPVARVAPRGDALALFAATLGEAPTLKTRELLARHDAALGYLLDAAASLAADRLAGLTAARFLSALGPRAGPRTRVLPYSPGYCGWPTAGQHGLFARLRPQEAGVRLNESGLMWPLKSVSGVLVAGPPQAHDFEDDFPFCRACATHECRNRSAAAAGGPAWRS